MQVMEEQNLSLTQNYNTVKDELVDTRHKYNEARENYLTAVAEKDYGNIRNRFGKP